MRWNQSAETQSEEQNQSNGVLRVEKRQGGAAAVSSRADNVPKLFWNAGLWFVLAKVGHLMEPENPFLGVHRVPL